MQGYRPNGGSVNAAYNQARGRMRAGGKDELRRAEAIQELLNQAYVVWPYRFYDHIRHLATGLEPTVEFFDTGRNSPDAFTPANTSRSDATTNVKTGTNFMAEGEIFLCFGLNTTYAPRFTAPGPVPGDELTLKEDIAFIQGGGANVNVRFNNRDNVMTEVLYNIPKGITPDWTTAAFPSVNNVLVFQPVASLTLADRSFVRIIQAHPNSGVPLPNGEPVIQGYYLTGYRLLPGGRYAGSPQQVLQDLSVANV